MLARASLYLIDAIEQVQHNFTKRIPAIMSLPYSERLAILDLELLELRRFRFDLIYYYKVLHNLTPINPDDVFITYTPDERCRLNLPICRNQLKPQIDTCPPCFSETWMHGIHCLLPCNNRLHFLLSNKG
jgi:hypothetical protein